MAYEDPDKFISDSTLFLLPGAMILWLLIFMIVTLSYSVNSPPKVMPRAVNLGLVGVASVFMGLWLLGLMVCYCRGTFLKGRSGRDVAPEPPGWGEDMEKRMCKLEEQTKPPTPLPGQAQRNHQQEQIRQRDERLLKSNQFSNPFILRVSNRFILSNFQHNNSHLDNSSPFHNNNLIHTQYNQNLCVITRPSNRKLSTNPNNRPIKMISQPPTVSRPCKPIPTSHERLQFQYPEHTDYDVSSSSLIKPASEGPVDRAGSLREPWLAAERKSESPPGFRQFETESQFASSRRGLAERKALGACSRPSQTICTE
ncbi:hypothetical protein COL26b_000066 [Colletotrichum chrysophilum]|uniref:uncharacterized protein n=1 Tax=Colletotrichum chrysophilum TaxID=1836956 RepID=UPI0023008675|nr:uncharacterized protein COL26b_000066 [Colletotrichum chrysophilum]KAJ0381393.1 hypothetical protein COL26b_000066 [Colletotrichum chrysophilum]